MNIFYFIYLFIAYNIFRCFSADPYCSQGLKAGLGSMALPQLADCCNSSFQLQYATFSTGNLSTVSVSIYPEMLDLAFDVVLSLIKS